MSKKNRIKENNVFRVATKLSIFELHFSIGTQIFYMTVCSLCLNFKRMELHKIGGVENEADLPEDM